MKRVAWVIVLTVTLVFGALAPTRAANPPVFGGGIYFIQPSLFNSGGTLTRLEGSDLDIQMSGQGFDMTPRKFVWVAAGDEQVHVVSSGGQAKTIEVLDLFALARPSLSPDATQIAVQATETPLQPNSPPENLTIYVIDIADGSWRRVGPLPAQPVPGFEIPEWLATGNRIAYWGIEDNCTVIKIVDATTGSAETTIRDDGPTGCFNPDQNSGPRFHIASSEDGTRLLIPGHMQVYDVDTGALVTDLREEALAGLAAAGYEPDDRYPGQGNAGTFPLDGAISPDGTQLIFDGAVHRTSDDTYGLLLMMMNIDGTGFLILEGPIAVNPELTNNHNFSQLTPLWLPSYQPDAQIKTGASYVGNDVYNLTGKSQTATTKSAPGGSKTFYVRIQNDGEATDSFSVTGAGAPRGFTAKYLTGSKVITADVLDGTYSVTLAAGRSKVIKLVVGVKSATATGTTAILPVQITSASAGLKDVAKARLRAT